MQLVGDVMDADPIVRVHPDGSITTMTRGSGASEISGGTLVIASCSLPGGSLGKKKNQRHIKMLRGPLALEVVRAITAAGFIPGEIVTSVAWDCIDVQAFAEERHH